MRPKKLGAIAHSRSPPSHTSRQAAGVIAPPPTCSQAFIPHVMPCILIICVLVVYPSWRLDLKLFMVLNALLAVQGKLSAPLLHWLPGAPWVSHCVLGFKFKMRVALTDMSFLPTWDTWILFLSECSAVLAMHWEMGFVLWGRAHILGSGMWGFKNTWSDPLGAFSQWWKEVNHQLLRPWVLSEKSRQGSYRAQALKSKREGRRLFLLVDDS